MIEINNIHLKTNRTLIKDGSLKLHSGTINAIIGKSGTGKTTLLYLVGLLHPLNKALNYHFHGVDLQHENLDDFRRNHIHFVFQDYALFEHMIVIIFQNKTNILVPERVFNNKEERKTFIEGIHEICPLYQKSEVTNG